VEDVDNDDKEDDEENELTSKAEEERNFPRSFILFICFHEKIMLILF
jgi:hypothetical protein